MTFIIAEAGTGHFDDNPDERYRKAWALVRAAKDAGADAVKFQAFFDEPLFCPVEGDDARWPRWRKTFLTEHQWLAIYEDADQSGIDLILSVFSMRGIALLKEMKPRFVKVASRAAKTFPYDRLAGPFLISTGMGNPLACPLDAARLQCASAYPAPMTRWEKHEGLSDHSGAIWPGLDAICRGAQFLEAHFTIPGADTGNDVPVCLNTDQLKLLCEARDAIATMCGYGGGQPQADSGAS